MKNIIVIIICCFLCKTALVAQQKKITSKEYEPPALEDFQKDVEHVSPNTIRFIGKIIKITLNAKDNCNVSQNYIATIEITKVLGYGASLINPFNTNDKLSMLFTLGFSRVANNSKTVLTGIKENQTFVAEASEQICSDTSKTKYSVSSYTVQY